MRVVAALEIGRVEGYRQAAEVFGVSERLVSAWWRAYRRAGRVGLATRERRPGPAELITLEDRGTLFAAMADYAPEELLIGGLLWTLCRSKVVAAGQAACRYSLMKSPRMRVRRTLRVPTALPWRA